jgi:hypothetical protein
MHPANTSDSRRPSRRLAFLALTIAAALLQSNGSAQSGPTPPSGVGTAFPSFLTAGDPILLTVDVFPGENPTSTGLAVTTDLTPIGGSASQTFFDDGTNGDMIAGDNSFAFQTTVALSTPGNFFELTARITDAQGREAEAWIFLMVDAATVPLAIHDIQGSGVASPYVGVRVQTSGIVTGRRPGMFFIQAPDGDVDADPNTSEAILVFDPMTPPAVGSLVDVTGTVTEFAANQKTVTSIAGLPSVVVLSSGNTLPAPVTLTAGDTPADGGLDVLERLEGMRVHVPVLRVVGPTGAQSISELNATSTSNGVFYGVVDGVARPFRGAGVDPFSTPPAGLPSNVPQFDGNPERFRVDSDGQLTAAQLEVAAGQTVADLVGPLDYEFNAYTIVPDPAPGYAVAGPQAAVAVRTPAAHEFTVATLNLQRLFDDTNDPAMTEPLVTPAAFENRLSKLSLLVRDALQTPDVVGVAEVENEATLQRLADRINADLGSSDFYQAHLLEMEDVGPGLPVERGLDVGFLVKGSRVNVVGVAQEGADATFDDPTAGTLTLNDRPPLVLRTEVGTPSGGTFPVTFVASHLSDPLDNPTARLKRRLQAEFLAGIVQARQMANPAERIVVLGDFNATQFNDGLVDVFGAIRGTPAPADQVLEASADLVDPNLVDLGAAAPASERYSFVFDGNAHQLDHILITQNLQSSFAELQYGRVNADFPESLRGIPSRPERVSDHDPLVAYFSFPATATIDDVTVAEGNAGQTLAAFTVSVDNGTGNDVVVGFTTADGSGPDAALAGQDYVAQTGQLTFGPGTSQRTINVALVGDTRFENNESFVVNLVSQAQPAVVLTDAQGAGNIVNDDVPPSVSINDVAVAEGNSGTSTASFTVSLSAASGLPATVAFSTADGTAMQPSDYQSASGVLTFAAGQTSRTVTVTVVGDVVNEPNESFVVNLANPTNASIADPQGVGTITNDDAVAPAPAQGFSVGDAVVREPHGGHNLVHFKVTLSSAAPSWTSVKYTTANGTAKAGSDYKPESGTLVFHRGERFKTITIKVLADRVYEGNETFSVQLSNPANAAIADGSGVGTIVDNDRQPWLVIKQAHGREPAAGTAPLSFKLHLSHASEKSVVVRFRTSNGTALAGQDYVARDVVVNFAPLQLTRSVDVIVLADSRREPTETLIGRLSSATNAQIAVGAARGVIEDKGRK